MEDFFGWLLLFLMTILMISTVGIGLVLIIHGNLIGICPIIMGGIFGIFVYGIFDSLNE